MRAKLMLPPAELPESIIAAAGGKQAAASILYNRGFTRPGEVLSFLNHQNYHPTTPLDIPDMTGAVQAAARFIQASKKICIYGDYDVDGVTSTALLLEALAAAGAKTCWHVPNRFTEGYGLNEGVVRDLASQGIGLIITCDCGINAAAEIQLANSLSMGVVVTDHHEPPEQLPPALALVNPKFLPDGHPGRMLPGVGAAFMFARALLDHLGVDYNPGAWLDLLSLGIVADCVPLKDDNRYWLKEALPALRQTRRPGLAALINAAGLNPGHLTEEDIAFQLAPRLNACGRLASAEKAVNLLTAPDRAVATTLASELGQLNERRKELVQTIMEEAGARLPRPLPPALALYGPDWHEGVTGIAAGRLCEDHHRPVLMMARRKDGTVVGSARSVEGLSIYAVLSRCRDLLLRFGGHDAAAGFSLAEENVPLLVERIVNETLALTRGKAPIKKIAVDLVVEADRINRQLYDEIQILAPFGEDFPPPVLITRNLTVFSSRPTANEQHLRLILGRDNYRWQGIHWSAATKENPSTAGDFIYSLNINRWNNRENMQLVIIEALPAGDGAIPSTVAEVLDRRGLDPAVLNMEFAGAPCYFEGPGKPPAGAAGRYEINPANTLILLTIPPGPKILQELVAVVKPDRVVLAFDKPQPTSLNKFYALILGLAKFAVAHRDGLLSITMAASAVGEAETALLCGLKHLAATGLVELEQLDDDMYKVGPGRQRQPAPASPWHQRAISQVKESNAFRRYLAVASVKDIKELLQYR